MSEDNDYIMLCEINELKDNWRAWLIQRMNDEGSIVSRYEYHGSHPGLHIHADCQRGGVEFGPGSINTSMRLPSAGSGRDRAAPSRPDLFWNKAQQYYRMEHPKGDLL